MYKNMTAKLKKMAKENSVDELSDITKDQVMLRLARVALVMLLSVSGYLLNGYLSAMNKAMDNMAVSIGRISDTQEKISLMLARVDENVRNMDERLDKIETRKP